MALRWERSPGVVVRRYYRATIVNGHTLPLYAYIADNGAGWWNACISPSDRDQMMEHPLRMVIAGAPTLRDAKANAPETAFLSVAAKILERDWRADPVRGGEVAP